MESLDFKQLSLPLMSNPLDPEELRKQGYMIIDFLVDYFKNIESLPVQSQVEPGYLRKRIPDSAPHGSETLETILKDIQNDIIPGLTHWQSPNHFAYFQCNGSIPGILGETLAAGFNVVAFTWIASPASTELENIVMDWLANMLSLPKSFTFSGGGGGVMIGTTCEAVLITITAARDRALDSVGRDNINKLVVYGSDQTHSSTFKSAKIAGIHPDNLRIVRTTRADHFGLRADAVQAVIESDLKAGLIPLFLCATVGTTSTTAIDQVGPLCNLAKFYNIWIHIDAAYAGSACILPELRHMLDGVENADSFSFNAHKWFLSNLDCCCLWVQNPQALVRSLTTNPEYLKTKDIDSNQMVDYKDWQLTLSRRFRSLKIWLVLRSYGIENLRNYLRNHINMAASFEKFVLNDGRFELVVPRNLSLVCFRLSPTAIINNFDQNIIGEDELNGLNSELLESINSSGRVYLSHSIVDQIFFIRFAVGGPSTEMRHVTNAWKVIQDHANVVLARKFTLRTT